MRIRLKPTYTHLSPLHTSRGRWTRHSGGESAIAPDETPGGAERQRERGASRTHLKEAAGTVSVGFARP